MNREQYTPAAEEAKSLMRDRPRRMQALHVMIRSCRLCEQRRYIPAARPLVEGRPTDRIMLIGQAPGHLAVAEGRPLTGPTGRVLNRWLDRAGFPSGTLHKHIYLSMLTRCDPGKHPRADGDRLPSRAEVATCQPYLDAELALLQPEVILLLGRMAIRRFLGVDRLEDAVGRTFGGQDVVYNPLWPGILHARLLPLPHASTMSRWLNVPQHEAMLAQALTHLDSWRRELRL